MAATMTGTAATRAVSDDDDTFRLVIERINLRVNLAEGREHLDESSDTETHILAPTHLVRQPEDGQGPLCTDELRELSLLCTKQSSTDSGFSSVGVDQLVALQERLVQHVNMAASSQVVTEAVQQTAKASSPTEQAAALETWCHTTGSAKLATLQSGLQAAGICLTLATCPDMDRRVAANQDALEACSMLLRLHTTHHLIPSWNQQAVHLNATTDPKKSPTKKRRQSSGTATDTLTKLVAKHLYQPLLKTIPLVLQLLERLERLVGTVPMDDQQVCMIMDGALALLELDPSRHKQSAPLQAATVSLLTTMFARYPSHRESLLHDVLSVWQRLPMTKKQRISPVRCRTFLAERFATMLGPLVPTTSHVHTMTILLVSLVQASVVRPSYYQEEQQGESAEDHPTAIKWVSGVAPCHAVCDTLVQQLLARCRTKGSEFRPLWIQWVQDLLCLLLVPEYPAAELLLTSLMRHLHFDLTNNKNSKSSSLEPTYLTAAFDVLGKICAVQARILAWQRDHPLTMTTDVSMPDANADEMYVHCLCGSNETDTLLVDCDHCKAFSHAACVGVTRDTVPDEWECDGCRLARIVDRQRRQYPDNAALLDSAYAMRHSFLSTFSHASMGTTELDHAKHVHMAKWADELEQKATALQQPAPNKVVTDLLELWDAVGPSGEDLTEEGSTRAIVSLATTTSALLSSFRNQVSFILKLMSDESTPLLRKLSVKAIEKTVEGDPQLMLLPILTKAVSRRLQDDSISVREAAVAMVGSYVVQSPAVATSFGAALVPCLTDAGVSVRKRAVRIFQAILTSNPRYKGRATVCDIMLQCAADPKEEDGVRDLIYDLFGKLWLQDGDAIVPTIAGESQTPKAGPTSSGTASPLESLQDAVVGHSGPSSVVTPTPPAPNRTQNTPSVPQKRAEIAAEQMMEVVKAGGTAEHVEDLLNKLLGTEGLSADATKGRKRAERKKQRDSANKQCDQLVKALFELLLSVEEQRAHRASRVGKDLAATLQTIGVFADVSPTSVFCHLDTILPYLKADNGVSMDDETAIVGATCDIIHRLTPFFDEPELDRLAAGSLGGDLVQITYKFGNTALLSAVRALSSLVEHSERGDSSVFGKKLLQLAKTFYGYLCRKDTIEDFSTADEKIRSNTHRALRVLGLICQHHKTSIDSFTWGDEVESSDDEALPAAEVDGSNLTLACYRVFSKYLRKRDYSTKCAALRALGGIFLAQPRLMLKLEQVGLIAEVMSDEAHPSLQLESLQCWRNILIAEEKRIDGGQAQAKMDADKKITVTKRISGDQDGDSTLFGGVLTNHAPRLFEMTHSQDRRIRFAVVDLLGLLLRQGLVNPNEAVAFLFALQGDVDYSNIRALALKLLMTEGEKRPDLLRQHVCAGVKEAYSFQRAVYPKKTAVSALVTSRNKNGEVECIFSSVFKECIASSRKQRTGLFKNLLNLFEPGDTNPIILSPRRNSKVRDSLNTDEFPLLSFASQILAHLPYTVASDPLFIIHQIGSMVALQGSQVVDRFADLLRPFGLASSDEFDESNIAEDALERAARSKFPSRTQEARPMSAKEFDMDGFLNLCRDAAALILLLRLKLFLRNLYNLSETRCLEYDPSTKGPAVEKSVSKAEITKPFDASIPMAMHSKSAVDKDALIRQYAEFRRLMRAENCLDRTSSSETEDDHENTSTPRKRSASDD